MSVDLASRIAVENALDSRSVRYRPDAAVWVVDEGAPRAILDALIEQGWRPPT